MIEIENTEKREQVEEAIKLYRNMTEVERAEIKGFMKCILTINTYTNKNKKDMT